VSKLMLDKLSLTRGRTTDQIIVTAAIVINIIRTVATTADIPFFIQLSITPLFINLTTSEPPQVNIFKNPQFHQFLWEKKANLLE
jgi:hypothetical protein